MSKPSALVAEPETKKWNGRGHVAIFVRCLHLLDLDLLEDWPGVTEKTFNSKSANQNIQHRIRSVEWCLYKLFQLYDAEETRTKLRPFFPPLTPLQSLNLRAALLRCLSDLKKNGILERHILLRKTMLDECKGDKFEEMLSAVGMMVLRKVTKRLQESDGRGLPNADLGAVSGTTSLPLLLAHRVILQNSLNRRNKHKANAASSLAPHDQQKEELEAAKKRLSEKVGPIDDRVRQDIQILVENNWTSDRRWIDVIFNEGQTFTDGQESSCLARRFPSTEVKILNGTSTQSQSLLQDLSRRVEVHQARLESLQAFKESLISKTGTQNKPEKQLVPSELTSLNLNLNKHQALNLTDTTPIKPANYGILPQYKELMDSFRSDLLGYRKHDSGNPTPLKRRLEDNRFTAEDSPVEPPASPIPLASAGHSQLPESSRQVISSVPESTVSATEDVWPRKSSDEKRPRDLPSDAKRTPQVQDMLPPEPGNPESAKQINTVGPPKLESAVDLAKTLKSADANETNLSDPGDMVEEVSRAQTGGLETSQMNSLVDPSPDGSQRNRSLLDRTRESMSYFSQPTQAAARTQRARETQKSQKSNLHQLKTPTRPASEPEKLSSQSGDSTPREKLFEDEADYDSIFKSRPRIALSPVLSPDRTTFSSESDVEDKLQDLTLDSHDDYT